MMKIEAYAKKTYVALKNPFQTVFSVNPLVIDEVSNSFKENNCAYYVGVKNTVVIPQSLITHLSEYGFLQHTRDEMAYGGRAIDIYRRNPLTDRFMTGSSSGTALNVFYGINDFGIGTDGGGSVLAPAASLNLYGFISPLLCAEEMEKHTRNSTEGISFYPSIGYIARDFSVIERAIKSTLEIKENNNEVRLIVADAFMKTTCGKKIDGLAKKKHLLLSEVKFPILSGKRKDLIHFLENMNDEDIVISLEGPVDLEGIGDTVFGHFDERTTASQCKSGKGFMRVVNMCNKTALILPRKELACGLLLICKSDVGTISKMLELAYELLEENSELVTRYFQNLDMYLK